MTGHAQRAKGDILVLVGTRKGVFIFSSDVNRKSWEMSGPHWPGSDVFHVVYDERGDGRLWVVRNDPVFGSEIHRSDDLGATWRNAHGKTRTIVSDHEHQGQSPLARNTRAESRRT